MTPDDSKQINPSDLYQIMLTFVRFPYAQICRHSAAIELFQLLEAKGVDLPDGLAKALVDASAGDEDAERILLSLIEKKECESTFSGIDDMI
jgi:hypothetical protein